jgi:hypothetical protein
MLYSEGSKAFQRLQEELVRKSNERSIFACGGINVQHSQASSYVGLFASSPQDFMYYSEMMYTKAAELEGESFALSNQGLHFRKVKLLIDHQRQRYCLPLHYKSGALLEQSLYLRKIGPGLYSAFSDLDPESRFYSTKQNDLGYQTTTE